MYLHQQTNRDYWILLWATNEGHSILTKYTYPATQPTLRYISEKHNRQRKHHHQQQQWQ